jgi:hypothetical protein
LGHGGVRVVARAVGVAESTVSRGAGELDCGLELSGRVRAAGAGRKRLVDADPGLVPALLSLIEPDQRGDPESPLRWTVKSTRNLAAELTRQGHRVSHDTVASLLKAEGFFLQAPLAALLGVSVSRIGAAVREVTSALTALGHTIPVGALTVITA